jgi:hypothetical protein
MSDDQLTAKHTAFADIGGLKMTEAKATNLLVPWTCEGTKGLTFRIDLNDEGYYSYDAVQELPKVVEYRGELYARTGWNSDNGEVYYKRRPAKELARPM